MTTVDPGPVPVGFREQGQRDRIIGAGRATPDDETCGGGKRVSRRDPPVAMMARGPRRDSELRETKVVDAAVERGAEDLVAVADRSRRPNVAIEPACFNLDPLHAEVDRIGPGSFHG